MFKKRNVKGVNRRKRPRDDDIEDAKGSLSVQDGLDKSEEVGKSNGAGISTQLEPSEKASEANEEPGARNEPSKETVESLKVRARKSLFESSKLEQEERNVNEETVQLEKRANQLQKVDDQGHKLYTGKLKAKKADKWIAQSSHVKTNTVMDYQPDVCKDFLKNGYCGYGDSCKFLHYREEYKVAKKQPKEWEAVAKKHRKW